VAEQIEQGPAETVVKRHGKRGQSEKALNYCCVYSGRPCEQSVTHSVMHRSASTEI
jgi:hypothetical protein